MESYFIQKTDSGEWTDVFYRPDLERYSVEELKADNWYRVILAPSNLIDSNQKLVVSYELDGDIVRQQRDVINKTGDELTLAIKNKWFELRHIRNELLAQSDWTQVNDCPLQPEQKAAWVAYRQQLRDLTQQADPFNITWPVDPSGRTYQIGVARV